MMIIEKRILKQGGIIMASRREGIKVNDEQQKTAGSIMQNVDNISDTIKEISDKLVEKYCEPLDVEMEVILLELKENNSLTEIGRAHV